MIRAASCNVASFQLHLGLWHVVWSVWCMAVMLVFGVWLAVFDVARGVQCVVCGVVCVCVVRGLVCGVWCVVFGVCGLCRVRAVCRACVCVCAFVRICVVVRM